MEHRTMPRLVRGVALASVAVFLVTGAALAANGSAMMSAESPDPRSIPEAPDDHRSSSDDRSVPG